MSYLKYQLTSVLEGNMLYTPQIKSIDQTMSCDFPWLIYNLPGPRQVTQSAHTHTYTKTCICTFEITCTECKCLCVFEIAYVVKMVGFGISMLYPLKGNEVTNDTFSVSTSQMDSLTYVLQPEAPSMIYDQSLITQLQAVYTIDKSHQFS